MSDVCLPAKTELRGVGKATLKIDGSDVEHSVFRVVSVGGDTALCRADLAKANSKTTDAVPGAVKPKATSNVVKEGMTVALPMTLLQRVPPDHRQGLAFGTLAVPYKYQVRGDRSTSGGATLGGYFGWRETFSNTELQFVGFAGATKVDVPKVDKDGKADGTQSLAGFSYGLGVLSTLKASFKLGLVFGQDRVSNSAGYVNNGKTWVSLSLGYAYF
jgi:hypothetical protein